MPSVLMFTYWIESGKAKEAARVHLIAKEKNIISLSNKLSYQHSLNVFPSICSPTGRAN
jgi:hypothetical protein